VKYTVNSLLNIGDKRIKYLTPTVIHIEEKLAWTISSHFEDVCMVFIWASIADLLY
jgi:hypothetical protein